MKQYSWCFTIDDAAVPHIARRSWANKALICCDRCAARTTHDVYPSFYQLLEDMNTDTLKYHEPSGEDEVTLRYDTREKN